MCYHHGSPVDPEERDRAPPGTPRPNVALLSSFISSYLPGLEPQPAVLETCLYTVRPRRPLCPQPQGQERPPPHVPAVCGVQPPAPLAHPVTPQNTPDGDFILDRHPKHSNIVIGAGFSGMRGHPAPPWHPGHGRVPPQLLLPAGHGFKLAPVVGKLLCELSLGEEPSHSTAPFAIGRFPGVLRAVL